MLRRFDTRRCIMDYKSLYIDSQRELLGVESAELTALIKKKAPGAKVLIVPHHNPNLKKQIRCACAHPYTCSNLVEGDEIVGYDILVPEDWVKEDSPLLKNGRILGIIMHELGHIVHNDSELNASEEEAHSRRVPVLSEARADRYACEAGYAKELLSALRWRFWRHPFAGDDIAARIKLIKRWMKKHSA